MGEEKRTEDNYLKVPIIPVLVILGLAAWGVGDIINHVINWVNTW